MDIYKSIRKRAGAKELMIVGRAVVVVLCFISVLWVPVLLAVQGGQLFLYIQAISAYVSTDCSSLYLSYKLEKK